MSLGVTERTSETPSELLGHAAALGLSRQNTSELSACCHGLDAGGSLLGRPC